jgi:hypothetical protein
VGVLSLSESQESNIMADKIRRYNKVSLQSVISELTEWVGQTEEAMETAEDAGNQERVEELEARRDSLQDAVDALEEIE